MKGAVRAASYGKWSMVEIHHFSTHFDVPNDVDFQSLGPNLEEGVKRLPVALVSRFHTMPVSDDERTLYHGEYQPLPTEHLATGIVGLMLFAGIMLSGMYLFTAHSKTFLNRLFYASLSLVGLFQLPRYIFLVRDEAYSSTLGYGMNMISGIFYFISLAIIGFTFADILEFSSLTRMIYGKRGLSLAVFVHIVVDLSGFIYCLQSKSLGVFFASIYFRFYIIFDIAQNLTYSSILVVFGLRLILR